MGEVEELLSSSDELATTVAATTSAVVVPSGESVGAASEPGTIVEMNEYDFEIKRRQFNKQLLLSKPKRNRREEAPLVRIRDGEFGGPWKIRLDDVGGGQRRVWGPSAEELARFEHSKAQRMSARHHVKKNDLDDTTQSQSPNVDSIFHGRQERDYLGRTYMHPPQDLVDIRLDKAPGSFECFPPKRLIHRWTEHTKGVTTCKILPGPGHLFLSGSQDTRIKLWQVYGGEDRGCLRTFFGHTRPIKEVCWAPEGSSKFASCAYDKTIRYWDAEQGKCLQTIHTPDLPFCVRLHPDPSRPWCLMAGCADKRVLQWDLREPTTTNHCLEYNQHLDAINSITFYEGGRRFVTTSDDKTVRVWEFEIPVATRYVAEPEMHSMPIGLLHPDGQSIAFQSLAGQVVVYGASGDRFFNKRKRFVGHSTAGYACGLAFSPDGRYLASGDAKGHLVVWDWKTGQMVRKLAMGHQRVTIDVAWSPQSPSQLITASWDGSLGLWD